MEAPVNSKPCPGEAGLPPAELVVVNGRQSGARQPLTGPLTLLGRAPGCEIRLNVEGVQPLHAAIVYGPAGFLCRDLVGEGGVLVNDETAALAPLKHGDEICVGPFRFRLELTAAAPERVAESERDGLRIQAAAVAAQQAALNEEEIRLQGRRGALEKQEEQLAGRLEERRRRLLDLQDQTRQEREAFQAARAAAVQEQAVLRKELEAARDDAATVGKQARDERERLVQLRQRLRRRWRNHWEAHEAALARREKDLTARASRLHGEAENLRRGRAALVEERLRLNGDVELGKRQLRDQWQELALAQQQWEACLNQEHAEREKRGRELDARALSVAEAEHAWAERERSARLMLLDLHRESTGLETRIRNQRENLKQEETAVAQLRDVRQTTAAPAAPVLAPVATLAPADMDGAVVLRRVAECLADQRAHLLEQWQRLLQVQVDWRKEQEEAFSKLEASGLAVLEREQRLLAQERKLDAAAAEVRQRQQALAQKRYSLEGWQSRLTARETVWEGERAAHAAEAGAREQAAALQLQRLQDLALRREQQRCKDAEELAAARTRCEDLRRQYVALWEECQERRTELARDQRDLAARTQSVEQLRLEIIGRAHHSARAERRLEQLRKRTAARIAAGEQAIEAAHKALADESRRLDEIARRLHLQEARMAASRQELAQEQTAWEERQAAAADGEQRRRLEWERLLARRERDEQQLSRLRDELERVAALLMDQADAGPPAMQAA